ncbi:MULTISPECIES: hypothetical protein [unclassified Rhizobium]|uniref:hypothetical protein n=1 Tax=unclassified Rhizobium TaxID=2613769 RepID=UPI0025F5D459|nr:hypothetical protein [Rhizobium sp. UBA1881]
MNLEAILYNVADQDRGAELTVIDPFTGASTGIVFRVVGPDSLAAQRSRLQLQDELAEAADRDGRVPAAARESLVIDSLARLVLDLVADEAPGRRLAVSHANLVRLLRVPWVRAQVDEFAANRLNFKPGEQP